MLQNITAGAALFAFGLALGFGMRGDMASAQLSPPPGGIKRTILQRVDVPGSNYEVVLGMAEIPAGVASIGRHTHFGAEMGTVVEGGAALLVDGQPEKAMKAGDSYQVGAGVPHDAKTTTAGGKVIAVYVVEKGKPLATPAPK